MPYSLRLFSAAISVPSAERPCPSRTPHERPGPNWTGDWAESLPGTRYSIRRPRTSPGFFRDFRVLAPGGHALLGFQVGEGHRHLTHAYGHDVSVEAHLLHAGAHRRAPGRAPASSVIAQTTRQARAQETTPQGSPPRSPASRGGRAPALKQQQPKQPEASRSSSRSGAVPGRHRYDGSRLGNRRRSIPRKTADGTTATSLSGCRTPGGYSSGARVTVTPLSSWLKASWQESRDPHSW